MKDQTGCPQRAYATFGLALATLAEPHWSALTTLPLRRFRLLEVEAGHGLTSAPLRIDERILHYLAGQNVLDPRLQSLIQASPFPEWIAEDHKAVAAQAVRVFEATPKTVPSSIFAATTRRARKTPPPWRPTRPVGSCSLCGWKTFRQSGQTWEQLTLLWQREALLLPGAMLIQCAPGGITASARPWRRGCRAWWFWPAGSPSI